MTVNFVRIYEFSPVAIVHLNLVVECSCSICASKQEVALIDVI